MEKKEALERAGATVARGVAREETAHMRQRLDSTTDRFKREAASRIEGVASQIRQLGMKFERSEEAHAVARRLERSADYLRYRPSSEVAGDAWHTVRSSRVVWITGGLVAGALLFRILRGRS